MLRKILLSGIFFSLFFSIVSPAHAQEKAKSVSASVSASSTSSSKTFIYKEEDTRVEALRTFLENKNSPLAADAQSFVEEADRNDIDWKLVAAIAGLESSWAHAEPYNCYNSWGYNIFGDHMRCFASYKAAIEVISYDLRHLYMNKWGATDVYSIGRKYAAAPTWAPRVTVFMQQIENFHNRTAMPTLPISL